MLAGGLLPTDGCSSDGGLLPVDITSPAGGLLPAGGSLGVPLARQAFIGGAVLTVLDLSRERLEQGPEGLDSSWELVSKLG